MTTRDGSQLVLLAVIWGSAFLFIDVVVDEVEPLTAVAGRLVIAAAVLVPAAWAGGTLVPPRAAWRAVGFMAVFNNVIPFGLIMAAQEHIESSLAAALIGTMPLFVLLLTVLLRTESPSGEQVSGLVLGFVGAAVIVGPDVTDVTGSNFVAQAAVLGGALSYAASTVAARQWAKGPPLALSAGQLVVASAIAVPLALVVDGPGPGAISWHAAGAWVALGVVCSGVAYILFYGLVQRLAATQVAVVTYMIPVVAAVLGWSVLGEHLGLNLFAGLALILVGVMAVNGSLHGAYRRTASALRPSSPAD